MRAHRQFALLPMILVACGENHSPTETMTATTTVGTMAQTMSDPSGDPTAGDPSGDTMPTGPGESSDTGPDDTTSVPVPGAPIFIDLKTNVSTLTAGEAVTFTALLTDPDGVDDIIGGTLSDPSGMIGYGPFVAAGEGTYSISVSWDAMHQAEPIEFEDMGVTRSFRAEFFDQAANKVSKDVDLTLTCAEGAACGGVCTDLMMTAQHCGACGKVCASGCEDGGCAPAWGECVRFDEGFDTCDQICAASGQTCVENGCGKGWTVRGFGGNFECMNDELETHFAEPCGAIQPWELDRVTVKCCCTVDP